MDALRRALAQAAVAAARNGCQHSATSVLRRVRAALGPIRSDDESAGASAVEQGRSQLGSSVTHLVPVAGAGDDPRVAQGEQVA